MMAKKGELSKTARSSLASRVQQDHLTNHIDPITGERIMLSQLMPVKVLQHGRSYMVFYNKDNYRVS
jgi:hypothetical protein